MMKKITISEIRVLLSKEDTMFGPLPEYITKATSLQNADEYSITWISKKRKDISDLIKQSKAGITIISKHSELHEVSTFVIRTEDPRRLFARIVKQFFSEPKYYQLHYSAVIFPGVVMGDNCNIEAGCVIYGNVRIGNNVNIHAGTVIGGDGFGYNRNESGEMEKFPQIGGVVIGDDVEIGANTCIDRGTLDDTIIESGCKIDNLVHIAHNVHIKKNSVIIAHAMIGGSTVIEEGSWVAPSAALMNGITIGKGALIGLGAVITKSVPEFETWLGNPGHKK